MWPYVFNGCELTGASHLNGIPVTVGSARMTHSQAGVASIASVSNFNEMSFVY